VRVARWQQEDTMHVTLDFAIAGAANVSIAGL